ncbi:MAG: hypothetical protein ACYDCJ_13530 [Gammaproteobacteria bacterium]
MTEKELIELVDAACKRFYGESSKLESAIGMLFVGRMFGWKVLYLIHTKSTIRKYEKILGLENIRDVLESETEFSRKSLAYSALKGVSNFWKAVKGEIKDVRSPILKK